MRSVRFSRGWIVAGVSLAIFAAGARARASGPKRQYHLFNPTPRAEMRAMSTDRPDGTESPVTVDAGHLQLELSLLDYTRDRTAGSKRESWIVLDTNVKLGILDSFDLQLLFGAATHLSSSVGGVESSSTSFGDVTLRGKLNLWGNEGGRTAAGLLPFVTIPTFTSISSEHLQGGLVTTFSVSAHPRLGIAAQVQLAAVYDPADDGYDLEVVHTTVFGLSVVGPLGIYVEYIGKASSDADATYLPILSSGLTVGLGDDLQLDLATQIGLVDEADDLKLFGGVSYRY